MKRFREGLFPLLLPIATSISNGCTTLPNVSEVMEDVPAEARSPEIVGVNGPLREQASQKLQRHQSLAVA